MVMVSGLEITKGSQAKMTNKNPEHASFALLHLIGVRDMGIRAKQGFVLSL
jgi:hypothetical protein